MADLQNNGNKVVIVDDEPIIIMDITEILNDNGFEVVGSAGNGYEAIELCEKVKPDILLMDINIPCLDGLTAAEYIVREGNADAVVMVTAYSESSLIERAIDFGAFGYIIKPINEKTLISTINVAVAKSREINNLKNEIKEAELKIEGRKKIERAKGILMVNRNFSEQKAYEYIRERSKENQMSMEKIADIVIFGEKFGDKKC